MTEKRHADLLIHADTSHEAPSLHRAQIVHRFRLGVYLLLGLLGAGAIITVVLRMSHAKALDARRAARD